MALRVLELSRLLEVDLHVWHFRINALGIFDSPSAKGAICPLFYRDKYMDLWTVQKCLSVGTIES